MTRPIKPEDARFRGRKAYRDGVPFQANPEHGLGDWQDWRAGWCEEEAKAAKAKVKVKKEKKTS